MIDIINVAPVNTEAELDRLAKRYRGASGPGLRLLNVAGSRAESLIERLPAVIRDNLVDATEAALRVSMRAANGSRSALPDQKAWVNTAMASALGAAGGFGGAPTALMELPVTTTLLLRSIQGAARKEGFDPGAPNVTFDCIRVLSAAGPLEEDDGSDLGFYTVRMTLTGGAVQKMISAVAPKVAVSMGQKLATQTIPVLGAVAGATTNYIYARYYQEIAHVHFGLRRLAIEADVPRERLVEQLKDRMRLS
ncbi:EcsC protein family protein [Marinibacterium anthonyi]|nr:EcsC protein family protein [Marinibacterium anthonyi]|tara:strand:+ start:56 stop:808 length:753 start_codon:yes stop_codon:yes gene_type:complete